VQPIVPLIWVNDYRGYNGIDHQLPTLEFFKLIYVLRPVRCQDKAR